MKGKIINVGLMFNISEGEIIVRKKRGLIKDIWNEIKKKLKDKNYKINEIEITNDSNYNLNIDTLYKTNKYDIIVGGFFKNNERLKKVDFTIPIFTISPLIVYDPNRGIISKIKYITYLVSLWFIPVIILIIASIFVAFIFYLSKNRKSNVQKTLYYSIAGFFGQTGGILSYTNTKNKKNIIVAIICFIIIFFFTIYINAFTTARSVLYFQRSHKLEYSIENSRILANPDDLASQLIPRNNGIIVNIKDIKKHSPDGNINKNIFEYFLENKDKMNLDGLLYTGFVDSSKVGKPYGLKTSNFVLGSYKVSFALKKDNIQLLKDINESIQILDDTGDLEEICDMWTSRKHSEFTHIYC